MVQINRKHSGSFVSQYPPPYQQPPYPGQGSFDYYRQGVNPLGPARRASVLMFVLCGLGLLCGAFITFAGVIMTPEMIAQSPNSADFQEFERQFSGISIRAVMIAMGVFCRLPSILYGIMGFFVRSGKMAPVVLSMVLTGIMVLLGLFGLLSVLVSGARNPAALPGGICMVGIPLVLSIVLLVTLIQALRAAPTVAAAQQQFQAQYWQSMQQQQAAQLGYGYGMPQSGYGYGAPPPTQPPAPPGQAPVDYQAPLMPPPPPPAPDYPRDPDQNSQG